jgi:hypothetical protein
MRITQRIITKQGHPVPSSSHAPRGPFPPELYAQEPVVTDYVPFDDEHPRGATAQNNFTSPKLFRCKECHVIVLEHEVPDHWCEEEGEDNGEDA